MMYLWPLGNFFKGFRVISFVDSAQTSFLLITKMPVPDEKDRQSHLHACRREAFCISLASSHKAL